MASTIEDNVVANPGPTASDDSRLADEPLRQLQKLRVSPVYRLRLPTILCFLVDGADVAGFRNALEISALLELSSSKVDPPAVCTMRDKVTINCAIERLEAKLKELEEEDLKYTALWKVYSQRLNALKWVVGESDRILLPMTIEELLKG